MTQRLTVLLALLVTGCDSEAAQPVDPVPVGRACTPEAIGRGMIEFSEVSPVLIGGLAALWKHIEYPEADRLAGTEGTVVLRFVVGLDGWACDPAVARGVSSRLDAAAMEAIQRVRFTPGRQNGQPVAVRMSVPVRFVAGRSGQ